MKCSKACGTRKDEEFFSICATVAVNLFAEMHFIDSASCSEDAEEEPPPECPDLVSHSVHAHFSLFFPFVVILLSRSVLSRFLAEGCWLQNETEQ